MKDNLVNDLVNDCISRAAALKGLEDLNIASFYEENEQSKEVYMETKAMLKALPSAQPQYEELTPEEAASEIASGSTMSTWYWLDDMIRLNQMGYAICRKR